MTPENHHLPDRHTTEESNLNPRTEQIAAVPTGANKRRRAHDDDMSRKHKVVREPERAEPEEEGNLVQGENGEEGTRTPKRLHLAPAIIPLGNHSTEAQRYLPTILHRSACFILNQDRAVREGLQTWYTDSFK